MCSGVAWEWAGKAERLCSSTPQKRSRRDRQQVKEDGIVRNLTEIAEKIV
jgi:hypothetical protein